MLDHERGRPAGALQSTLAARRITERRLDCHARTRVTPRRGEPLFFVTLTQPSFVEGTHCD